jgi:hypothetical protein
MTTLEYKNLQDLPTKAMVDFILPWSMPGSEMKIRHFRYGIPGSSPRIYLQASIHADEIPGMLVLHHLMRLLDTADRARHIRGELIIVPAANPLGLSQWAFGQQQGRFESKNGINFNRDYPDLNEVLVEEMKNQLNDEAAENREMIRQSALNELGKIQPRTPVEAMKHHLLSEGLQSDYVLDLHCDDTALLHLYTTPASWPEFSDLASQLRTELVLLESISGGNPFDEACSRPWSDLVKSYPKHPILQGCHATTIELRGIHDVDQELASADAANLFRFLQRRKAVLGNPGPLPELLRTARPLKGLEQIRSPQAGIAVFRKKPGEEVKAGETVAELIDPHAEDPRNGMISIVCEHGGFFFARNSNHLVGAGDILARVCGDQPISGRSGPMLSP